MTATFRPRTGRSARHWRAWPLALAAVLAAGPLAAATCSVMASGVAFGDYDFLNATDLEGAGDITVTCDVDTSYTIALSAGNSGSYVARQMQNGSYLLQYNLYTDATRQQVWGDGTSGSSTFAGSGMGAVPYTVYGLVPARQNPYIGSYTDAITVTVTY